MRPRSEPYEGATSQILNAIATRFIVPRRSIYPDDPEVRKRMYGTARYVLQVLKSKSLIYIIPRRFIVNVPLVLVYYRLSNGDLERVCEAVLRKGHYLGSREARSVAERIVKEFLPIFKNFTDAVLRAARLHHEVVSRVDWDEVTGIIHSYIPYILSGEDVRPSDIVDDLRSYITRYISEGELEEFRLAWRGVLDSVESICSVDYDDNPHIESYCRRFMDRVVRYTLSVLYPSHYESLAMISARNLREEVILRMVHYFGSVSEDDLVRILHLLKKKGVDLGYLFISIGGKLVSSQVLDDIENLISRGLLKRGAKGELRLTALGRRALGQRPSKKVRAIMKSVEDIAKQ